MTDILDVEMPENDSGAATVRGYLVALLRTLWCEGEGFSGKRPFGNSGWQYDLAAPLVKAGILPGKIDEWGDLGAFDEAALDRLVLEAIDSFEKPKGAQQ